MLFDEKKKETHGMKVDSICMKENKCSYSIRAQDTMKWIRRKVYVLPT